MYTLAIIAFFSMILLNEVSAQDEFDFEDMIIEEERGCNSWLDQASGKRIVKPGLSTKYSSQSPDKAIVSMWTLYICQCTVKAFYCRNDYTGKSEIFKINYGDEHFEFPRPVQSLIIDCIRMEYNG